MSAPPPPATAAAPTPDATAAWVEPTRRLPFSPRFGYNGHYGAALVAVLLSGYLLLFSPLSQLALGLSGYGGQPPEETLLVLAQYLFAIAVLVVGLLIAPATSGRRIIAVVLVLVVLILWTIIAAARVTGAAGPFPFATGFVTSSSFIAPLVTTLGWLIVRERPGVTYLLLLLTLIGGAVPVLLTLNAVPSAIAVSITTPLAAGIGIGIAWAARGIAAAIGRVHSHDDLVDPPAA